MRRVYFQSRDGATFFLVAEDDQQLASITEKLRALGIKYRY